MQQRSNRSQQGLPRQGDNLQNPMWMLWLLKSCTGQSWNTNFAQQGMLTR